MSEFIRKNGKWYRNNSDGTQTQVIKGEDNHFYWTQSDGKKVRSSKAYKFTPIKKESTWDKVKQGLKNFGHYSAMGENPAGYTSEGWKLEDNGNFENRPTKGSEQLRVINGIAGLTALSGYGGAAALSATPAIVPEITMGQLPWWQTVIGTASGSIATGMTADKISEAISGKTIGQHIKEGVKGYGNLLDFKNHAAGNFITDALVPDMAWDMVNPFYGINPSNVIEGFNTKALPYLTDKAAKAYINLPTWDKWTTKGARLGMWGDNISDKFTGTLSRRLGIGTPTPRIPYLIRAEKRGIEGALNPRTRFPWVNTTTSQHVLPHRTNPRGWQGNDVILFNSKNIDPKRYLSIEPMDTYITGRVNPDVYISGDVEALKKAQEAGLETISSSRLRKLFKQGKLKEDSDFLYYFGRSEEGLKYTKEIERLLKQRGIPTAQDYAYMAEQTGLPKPDLNLNLPIRSTVRTYIGPLRYDPAPPIESKFRNRIGMDSKGNYEEGFPVLTDNQLQYLARHPEADPMMFKPWELKILPGYQIKSLMTGSPIEKQLSKQGTISVKQLQAYIGRNDVSTIDKELLGRVLQNHVGETHIDYNTLRQEVQGMIPQYNRVSQTKWQDYGISSLGFKDKINHDAQGIRFNELTGEFEQYQDIPDFKPDYILNTFTFESPGVIGNNNHYGGNPLGHSRTYTTANEPDVLHVMESQSDWAQNRPSSKEVERFLNSYERKKQILLKSIDDFTEIMNTRKNSDGSPLTEWDYHAVQDNMADKLAALKELEEYYKSLTQPNILEGYMQKSYLNRQLQENLKYAAENGQTKMRYPTPETAAKIEGYQPIENNNSRTEFEQSQPWYQYSPEHQTILKKYADFPKQYQKLFGKQAQVRTVTDAKGNTWYEVDVPQSYIDGTAEMLFKKGGKIIEQFRKYRKGNKIYIKEKNKGKFTKSAKASGQSVQEHAKSVLNNPNATALQKKRANFARNAAKWNKK